ncbi:hypothetical protein theurythT_19330 [Thalassotalea eurytherma]|uniref:Transposase n=1 Tax=Thalassotalea eurytherma TaxID=1144278 RepID=A0ABQ6H2S6_9GAMM|nr:hypothetical protein theurythT_19330 [Thalassotalea eurytherma]
MTFTSQNQPENRGRPKGSKNKRSLIPDNLSKKAIIQLTDALNKGEQWAVEAVLKRSFPVLKPITPCDSLDADLIKAKIKEVYELEQRIEAIERTVK